MNYLLGLLLVFAAGLGTGTVAWPMKLIRRLEFEHYWLVGMFIGLICLPWVVVLTQVPDPWRALAEAGWRPLLISNLCAVGWGAANVLYGVCVVRIGAALTGALLSGAGAMVAITMPMVFKGSGLFGAAPNLLSATGMGILCGLMVMLLGVAVTAIAGFGRDKLRGHSDAGAGHGFLSGLIMTLVAGVLSAGLSLAFVYGQGPLMTAFLAQGVSKSVANIGVWAAAIFGGALVNVLYPVFVISRKKTWRAFASAGSDLFLGAMIGIQFIIAVFLLGRGMLLLGALGASIGVGVQMVTQLFGNQLVGFVSGEWRGIRGRPMAFMCGGILLLSVAAAILALCKYIG
jgi:L-rhamnose-H+ transport protein